MSTPAVTDQVLRDQLLNRRDRLRRAAESAPAEAAVARLIEEVDDALARFEAGTYGLCDVCHDTVERERLIGDPLLRTCLDHLTRDERSDLERDLDLAARVQGVLLPEREVAAAGWRAAWHYEPAGVVGGDYCDLLTTGADGGALHFLVGDVAGKGIAAALLMAGLRATVRTLIDARLPVGAVMERVNRLFCESTLPAHFATLVLGRADGDGGVEIANAGHCPPLVLRRDDATSIAPTGLPLGLFCRGDYAVTRTTLAPGDAIVVHTDGLSEARDRQENEYGDRRLAAVARRARAGTPRDLLTACLDDLARFRAGGPLHDDLTILAIGRD